MRNKLLTPSFFHIRCEILLKMKCLCMLKCCFWDGKINFQMENIFVHKHVCMCMICICMFLSTYKPRLITVNLFWVLKSGNYFPLFLNCVDIQFFPFLFIIAIRDIIFQIQINEHKRIWILVVCRPYVKEIKESLYKLPVYNIM